MPNYEFQCKDCKKEYSVHLSLADYEKKKYQCPECKSSNVKQQITAFQTKTSRKSWYRLRYSQSRIPGIRVAKANLGKQKCVMRE